ncbi:MAG: protein-export chaperone SecB [Alphaproteobacteria bacterium]|nr:protein-export chaperone SecB [Alphaproteobacteria bacterium]
MSDQTAPPGGAPEQAQQPMPQIQINVQYVKDLSFESPNAPQILLQPASGQPKIDVSVDVQARSGGDSRYEVELHINATAERAGERAFVVEVAYAGIFTLLNVPQEAIRLVCLIECPRLLFPFVRRIIADCTRDGGFPPLMLEPIDFAQLLRQQAARAQAATSSPVA